MHDVFLSYAKEDVGRAERVAEALRRAGFSVWWDRKIIPGKQFDNVIAEAIAAARCLIVLWSSASCASEWVKDEASEGLSRNTLVPACIDRVEPPFGFRRRQAAQLADWDGDPGHPEFAQLLSAVEALVGPRAVAPAPEGPVEVPAPTPEREPTPDPDPVPQRSRRRVPFLLIAFLAGHVIFALYNANGAAGDRYRAGGSVLLFVAPVVLLLFLFLGASRLRTSRVCFAGVVVQCVASLFVGATSADLAAFSAVAGGLGFVVLGILYARSERRSAEALAPG